ncbi:DOMON domain-containing protein FRRS1L isoform X3 [Numida meleagris]|uniref:DOMON domain-containing protein FRRS1L isoform X3 n=1 Tax=Numida meleagris TaxID=8996 RepID=UPI000B3DE3D9|nr:DOMON domain-containing protein FRRS1L isoform X3 [Numida meleagris]
MFCILLKGESIHSVSIPTAEESEFSPLQIFRGIQACTKSQPSGDPQALAECPAPCSCCQSLHGYPFPTAPPVDPFAKIRVDDCGKTKGCFRYGKPGCNAETCDYFLSYRRIGADVEFELSADTDGWVAVGFSSDKKMGGDDVMACVHDDNGRVRIQHFYNVGQWAKEIQRNPARDEEGVFENNRVTCRFKRPVSVPREETIVDLHLSWYYLFAWGPAIQATSVSSILVSHLRLPGNCSCVDCTPSE